EQFRLGVILLRKKKISRPQCETIDNLMRREGGRFGQIAIQQDVFTEAQLQDFLKVQVSEIIYDCFVWPGGMFAFSDEMHLPQHAVTISVDLTNLIMEGARRIEEWEQCIRLLPDKGVVFRVISKQEKGEKITLTVDEWRILFLINGVRTLEELCHESEDDPFDIYRLVYGLQSNHLIEAVPPEELNELSDVVVDSKTGSGDATVRQAGAVFSGDSTVRSITDDTSLLVSSEANLSYKDVVRPTVAQIAFASGDLKGMVVPLIESEYLVGRRQENQIQIPDLGVSGFHARIYRGPDGFAVEDLKSRNGTWLNGTRIFHGTLKNGDRLRIGATELVYTVLYEGDSREPFPE
ncbi:MAG TPA: FHA domain-containing protein, partial [Thermoanaerobaculia bacterium]|nr:FHA domain-containing protein [Thermoanaerobaculia bacterium]